MSQVVAGIVGDEMRQAIDALRGYSYQIYSSAIAWLNLSPNELLHLETAEDFSTSDGASLTATQSRATGAAITLNSPSVAELIDSFVFLTKRNPHLQVTVRYLTTSKISKEHAVADRVDGVAGLEYWRRAAILADVAPLRAKIDELALKAETRSLLASLTDQDYRDKFLKRIVWHTENPGLEPLKQLFRQAVLRVGRQRGHSTSVIAKCVEPIIVRISDVCTTHGNRSLSSLDLDELIAECTSIRVPIDQHLQMLNSLISQQLGQGGASVTLERTVLHPVLIPAGVDFAVRSSLKESIVQILQANAECWLHAGTGFGKTTLARLVAQQIGGEWRTINLRNVTADEASSYLYLAADAISNGTMRGVIVDDIDHLEDVSEGLSALIFSARNSDCCLMVSSHSIPSESKQASLGFGRAIALKIPELTEDDVSEVVTALGGDAQLWTRYVHLSAGAGHPQLVQALVRHFANRGWPLEELRDLSALLGANTEINRVRTETRQRIFASLPMAALDLLTRLTLV